jgi:hypothetical protein
VIGKTIGGKHPQGWRCSRSPYLIELDNWSGIDGVPGQAAVSRIGVWGYDEIAWFAHQDSRSRESWLRYAYNYLKANDANGHFEMPGFRTLGSSERTVHFQALRGHSLDIEKRPVLSTNVSEAQLNAVASFEDPRRLVIRYSGHKDCVVEPSSVGWKISELNIRIKFSTILSFKIFPMQENDCYAYVDLRFSDGSLLGASLPECRLEVPIGASQMWTLRAYHLGKLAPYKTITEILVKYSGGGLSGEFGRFIDELLIYDQGFYNAARRSSTFPSSYDDEATIKNIWQEIP